MSEQLLQRLDEIARWLQDDPQLEQVGREIVQIASALQEHLDRIEKIAQEGRRETDQFALAGRLVEMGTMAASVFHEMNQPLVGIKGFAELLQENIDAGQPEKLAGWAKEIRSQVERVQRMQERVTTFLRPEATDGEPVALASAVREALLLFQHRLAKKKIRVGTSIPDDLPLVQVDRQHLIQILVNLVGNALDAIEGQPERVLRILAKPAADDGAIRILVTDTGAGIPAEDQERVFDPFHSTKGEKGSGLGLFISRRLAEQNGGRLSLVNPDALKWKKAPSTAFELRLPVAGHEEPDEVADLESATEAVQGPDSTLLRLNERMQSYARRLDVTRRVLVVDDEAVILRILSEFLAGQGILADVVPSAEEAVEKLQSVGYAVVITDKNLPGMDGIELLGQIKSRWPRIEVLVITGYASVESALDAIGLGAFDYIPKPFPSLGYIGDKLRGALDRHEFEHKVHAMIGFLTQTNKALFAEMGGAEQEGVARHLKELLARYHEREQGGSVAVLGPKTMSRSAENLGYRVEVVESLDQAVAVVEQRDVQVLVYVEEEGGLDGAEVVRLLQEADPGVGVFVIGREGNLNKIVDAIGMGVGDYLVRPVEGEEMFATRLERLIVRQQQVQRYRNLIDALKRLNVDLLAARQPDS